MQANPTVRGWLRRPLLWILVFGVLCAAGIHSLIRIPVEVLPRFAYPEISVVAHQPGATAAELETLVVRPLEGEILGLPDLEAVRSVMGDGTVEIDARFRNGTNAQLDLQAINGAIDRARSVLPGDAAPYAEIMGNAINEVADYTAEIPAGVSPAEVQRDALANVVPALRALPGVQRVQLYGAGDEALWIQPDLAAMHRYGVSAADLTAALGDQVILRSGGYLTQGHQDVPMEARSLPTRVADLRPVPVRTAAGPVPLSALARIVRAPVPIHNAVELDGKPGVTLIVLKQPGASTIPVSRSVQETIERTQGLLPVGVHWIRTYDQGRLVQAVGSDLGRNLLVGALLAVAVLMWMLGARRGIWVLATSIPLSLLIGIAGLQLAGQSLNLMTLGALTVAVGLLADDAIIVLESIYHRWEQGDDRWTGIRRGLRDIAGPDITGTLTTVAVFVPLLFVGGLAGLFFIPFALAMTLALLASLAVSLTYIPLALGLTGSKAAAGTAGGGRVLERLRLWNEHLFSWVAKRPITSLVVTCVILLLSLAGLAFVPIDFLPLPNEGVLLESFTLPPGSSLADSQAAVAGISRRLMKDPAVAHVAARIGSASGTSYTEPAYAGEIQVTLKPGVNVNSLDAIGNRVLAESRTTGVQLSVDTPTIERVGESLSGLPQPFVIHVFGSRIPELRALAGEITRRLRGISELTDLFNNDGYPVTQVRITPRVAALAADRLTPASLYAQLRPLLAGEVVARVPEGQVPLDLYVRLADAHDLDLGALKGVPIRTGLPTGPGAWTTLGQVADATYEAVPNQLRHIDGARSLDILATPLGPLGSVVSKARSALADLKLPPGYRIAFGGLYPELESAAVGLGVAALAALVLMVGILVLQFDGLLVPGLLLLEIPLAVMGGAIALLVSGVGLNATGMVAFLTLIGIGLNHGIVLLHRARANEAAGMPLEEAMREAIHVRFRPIVLTTLTAVLGMLPTALGWGEGAAPEQGLAIVILGGVLWSAVRSTNLIPALYLHWRRRQLERTKS